MLEINKFILQLLLLRLNFTSDGSRSRREPYALVKTARHKQKKKETLPFSSASASVASENQPLVVLHQQLEKYEIRRCRLTASPKLSPVVAAK